MISFNCPTCGLCWGTNYWLALWNVCHVGKYISVRYYPLPVICHDKIISNIITVIIIESSKYSGGVHVLSVKWD